MNLNILCTILAMISYCASNGQVKITGRYINDSKESFITIHDEGKDDFIIGKHCFVFSNGERIDCCVDEEYSIKAKKKKKKKNIIIYEGILISCYDNLQYKIRLTFENKLLKFYFIDGLHPFVPKELKLHKE